MKFRRTTATPINFLLEALYVRGFGELPGSTQTIVVALLTRYGARGSPLARA
jgi:hypothetical protein